MIAASHIATTATSSVGTSSKPGTRQDDSTQSFSESLGKAKQAVHTEHVAPQSSSAKHSKDAKDDTKTHVRRDENTVQVTNPAQQAEPAKQAASVLSLPAHLFQSSTQDSGAFADALGTSNATSSPSLTIDSTAGNGRPAYTWNQQNLPVAGAKSGAVLGSMKSVNAEDTAGIQATTPSVSADDVSELPSRDDNEDTEASVNAKLPDQAATTAPLAQDPIAKAEAATSTAQVPTAQLGAASQTTPVPQNFTPSTPIAGVLPTSGVASAKANAALKGLQTIAGGSKNADGLTNKQVAGAKDTDSYLSIQKNAKDESSFAKDSLNTQSQQHSSHNDQTNDAVAAQTVVPSQAHAVINSQPHLQSANVTLDSTKATEQNQVSATVDANLDHAFTTNQTAASDHVSSIVNSAKLIQSISQSEMRVGMRTAEFGDISIRTASTRDAISAQISLAHGDLAKTLTAHMPEMQTRLASGEVVNVSIQHESQSGGYDGGRNDTSQSGSQSQAENEGSRRSNQYGTYASSTGATAISAPVFAARSETAGRLDIRA